MVIIGLKKPEFFEIRHINNPDNNRRLGMVYINSERDAFSGEENLLSVETVEKK